MKFLNIFKDLPFFSRLSRRQLIGLFTLVIVIYALPVAIYLVQQRQLIEKKAAPAGLEGYGVEYASSSDFPTFKDWGVDLVLFSFHNVPSSNWANVYDQAIANNIKLIAQYWNGWGDGGGSWQLLDFISQNEAYKSQTFAIFGLHEPCNPAGGRTYSHSERVSLYNQIRSRHPWVKIYSEDENQCGDFGPNEADYDHVTLYNFAYAGGQAVWNDGWGRVIYDYEQAEQAARDRIDHFDQKYRDLGTQTKSIALIQTFAYEPSFGTIWNRMPTTNEMRDWANLIIGSGKIAGIMWYAWDNPAGYSYVLHNDRYDPQGGDRWAVVAEVGQGLPTVSPTPSPTPAPSPSPIPSPSPVPSPTIKPIESPSPIPSPIPPSPIPPPSPSPIPSPSLIPSPTPTPTPVPSKVCYVEINMSKLSFWKWWRVTAEVQVVEWVTPIDKATLEGHWSGAKIGTVSSRTNKYGKVRFRTGWMRTGDRVWFTVDRLTKDGQDYILTGELSDSASR